jgi:hypothetical protein
MSSRSLAFALIAAFATACLEQEESIVVHADGSLTVQVAAKGNATDLGDGYAVPLHAPWRAADAATLAWMREIGPDTGSATARDALAAGRWGKDDAELRAVADFASAADLPRVFAAPGEPYRDAFLERETSLSVERKGGRTVYVFERRYGARRYADLAVFEGLDRQLPEEIGTRVMNEEPLTDEQWLAVTTVVQSAFRRSAAGFAREALIAVYTLGDASISTAAVERALERVDRAVTAASSEAALRRMYAWVCDHDGDDELALPPDINPELLVRGALRAEIERALAEDGVAARTRNAVHERLERAFTAFDATVDLADEKLALRVELPGKVIDGNYAELEGSTAVWRFEGQELRDRELRMRAISVVE